MWKHAAAGLLLAAGWKADARTDVPCIYSNKGASFDLYDLYTNDGYFFMDALGNGAEASWDYFIGICANLPFSAVPTECAVTDSGGSTNDFPSPAFQVARDQSIPAEHRCHRLSGTLPESHPVFSLVDPNDPSFGVRLNYTGGDVCTAPDGSTYPRSTSIDLICDPHAVGVPGRNASAVIETNKCEYAVVVHTRSACPTQCNWRYNPTTGLGEVCSGHGICDYDRSNQQAKCFCNEGWHGASCNEHGAAHPDSKSYGGTYAGAFFGVAIGAALISFFGYRYYSSQQGATGRQQGGGGGMSGYAPMGDDAVGAVPAAQQTLWSGTSGGGGVAESGGDDGYRPPAEEPML